MKTIKYFKDLEYDFYDKDNSNFLYIFIHGGGLVEGDKNEIYDIANYFLDNNIEIASINYSLYPKVKYPEFINECVLAIKKIIDENKDKKVVLGGISAGAFIAMSIAFNEKFLKQVNLSPDIFDGFIFDAGQPTQHFRINEDLGLATWDSKITPIAPIYYIDNLKMKKNAKILLFAAEFDLPNRLEENENLYNLLKERNYNVTFIKMNGYKHCEYKESRQYLDSIFSFFKSL